MDFFCTLRKWNEIQAELSMASHPLVLPQINAELHNKWVKLASLQPTPRAIHHLAPIQSCMLSIIPRGKIVPFGSMDKCHIEIWRTNGAAYHANRAICTCVTICGGMDKCCAHYPYELCLIRRLIAGHTSRRARKAGNGAGDN